MENEIWKDIEGYEGYYQISNMGRVRSVERTIITKNGVARRYKKKQMKIFHDGGGYCFVVLSKEGECKKKKVHRLVALAFIPNPEGKEEINHKNEKKDDNRVENLEWMTRKENVNYGTGVIRSAKTRGKKVKCVETGKIYFSTRQAERETGIWHNDIGDVCNNIKGHLTAGGYHWAWA